MTITATRPKTIAFNQLVVPIGLLGTLVVMAVGGAMYASDIKHLADTAITEISKVRDELKEMRSDLHRNDNSVALLRAEKAALKGRVDHLEHEQDKLRERLRLVEMAVNK